MALIVTSDPDLAELLEQDGHRVDLREDPATAVTADCAVVRFDGGPIAGMEWIRHLRRGLGSTPLIAVVTTEDDAELALKAGANDIAMGRLVGSLLRVRVACWINRQDPSDPSSEARNVRDLLPRLVEAAPDPIIAANLKGRVLVFNPAAERVFGLSADEVLQRVHIAELYVDAAEARAVLNEIRTAPAQRIERRQVRLRDHRGGAFPAVLSAAMVQDNVGRPGATVGVFRDNREERDLAFRLVQAREQLMASERRGAAASATTQAIHELNQPLTSAMGHVELMLTDPNLTNASRDRLERVMRQLERLAGRIKGIGNPIA